MAECSPGDLWFWAAKLNHHCEARFICSAICVLYKAQSRLPIGARCVSGYESSFSASSQTQFPPFSLKRACKGIRTDRMHQCKQVLHPRVTAVCEKGVKPRVHCLAVRLKLCKKVLNIGAVVCHQFPRSVVAGCGGHTISNHQQDELRHENLCTLTHTHTHTSCPSYPCTIWLLCAECVCVGMED